MTKIHKNQTRRGKSPRKPHDRESSEIRQLQSSFSSSLRGLTILEADFEDGLDRLRIVLSDGKTALIEPCFVYRRPGTGGYPKNYAGLVLYSFSSQNVKEHATPLAGASVETGGEG